MNEHFITTVMQFQNPVVGTDNEIAAENAFMGSIGETGELMDYLKKIIFQGHTLDQDKLNKELADIGYYITLGQMATSFKNVEGDSNLNKKYLQFEPVIYQLGILLYWLYYEDYYQAETIYNIVVSLLSNQTVEQLGKTLNNKLSERYQEGKFNEKDSTNRKTPSDSHPQ